MKCNVGKGDKVFRLIIGVAIIAAGVYFKSWWGAVGIIPLLTGTTGFCPLYMPFKFSSTKKEEK